MAQDRVRQTIREQLTPNSTSYYALLGLHPSASPLEIRRAYRELSKRYHPDTTDLPATTATSKFQQLNEAYATLSSPERRVLYDQKIGYSRLNVIQSPPGLDDPVRQPKRVYKSSAYLDPTDRPLSAGEIFALFILGLTFVGCLLLAIAIGLTRGGSAFQVSPTSSNPAIIQKQQMIPINVELQTLSEQSLLTTKAPVILKSSQSKRY